MMCILKPSVLFIFVLLMLMAFLVGCDDSTSSLLTIAEQEVIEALLQQQDEASHISGKRVIEDTASVRRIRCNDSYNKFANDLREDAMHQDAAFKEALEDFLKKNRKDTKIVFPANAPKTVELVSDATIKEIFSKSNGWDVFYNRFPGSGGLIRISRVGIDSKGTVAIIYLGKQEHWLAGHGGIRVLRREGKKWVLTYESIGPFWTS